LSKRKHYVEREKGLEAVKDILSTERGSTFTEYLKENMELFLKSRKNVKEIYTILKEKDIFEGSYSWFRRVFEREKTRILEKLKNNNTEMDGGSEENQAILKEFFSTKEKYESQEKKIYCGRCLHARQSRRAAFSKVADLKILRKTRIEYRGKPGER
jgi:hypothetical protein